MKETGEEDGVDSIRVQLLASHLDKKDTIGSSDPYVVISQVKPDGSRVRVYQSPYLKNTLNPVWAPTNLYLPLLCNSDSDQPLVVEVWDYNKSEEHELIGATAPLTVSDLADAPESGTTFPLVHPFKRGKKGYTNSGVLGLRQADAYNAPRVQEYLDGGLRFKCMLAVDYTSANGPTTSASGLHYMGDGKLKVSNAYAATLAVLSSVMQKLNNNYPM